MNDLMVGRPIKFRVLEILADGEPKWNYELVDMLMKEYGESSDFHKYSINFDLIEVQASGFIYATESAVDEAGKFRSGSLLNKYKITSLGTAQYNDLCSNIMKKKGA